MPARSRKAARSRRYRPRQVQFQKRDAKYQLANKVELIRPITLKPTSAIRKFIFYNTAEIKNRLSTEGNNQQMQFVQHYLNSPWISASEAHATPGTSTWRWNKPMTVHADTDPGPAPSSGTSYPGLYDNAAAIGMGYQNQTVVGHKCTITATPLIDANVGPKAITALFAQVNAQASQLTENSTIDDLYEMPYTQVRKVTGGQQNNGDLGGNTKSAKIVIKYSPKRFNNVKDIRDVPKFSALLNLAGNSAKHPAERDSVVFGICNVLSNPENKKECVKVLLQLKHEVTILFAEPYSNYNRTIPLAARPVAPVNSGPPMMRVY